MKMINRSVVIIRAKQPFLEWTRGLPDRLEGLTLKQLNDDCHAYLFPEWDTQAEREELLADAYGLIFERELFGWHRDEREFPTNRSLAMFRQWFNVEFHSMVVDLVQEAIHKEEYD